MIINKEDLVKALKECEFICYHITKDWFENGDNKINVDLFLRVLEKIPERKDIISKEKLKVILKKCGYETGYEDYSLNQLIIELEKTNIFEGKDEETISMDEHDMVEDILKAFNKNPDIKISSENVMFLESQRNRTLLHFKKEFIQGGMEFKDFEVMDEDWVGRNMFVKNKNKKKPHEHKWQFAGKKVLGTGIYKTCKDLITIEIQKNYLEFVCPCGASMRVLEKDVEI